MRGKVRMLFLAILLVAMAGAAQADTIIPMVPGYTTTYKVNWAGVTPSNYTASMQITGGPEDHYSDGYQWWTLQLNNMDGGGGSDTSTSWVRATETAVYLNGSANPHFQIVEGITSWTDEEGRKPKIVAHGDFKTPGGITFTDVYTLNIDDHDGYQTLIEYWKPGVGFLGEVVPTSYGDSGKSRTTYITDYSTSAVPVPPSLLLLGSGLVGLLGLRGCRRS